MRQIFDHVSAGSRNPGIGCVNLRIQAVMHNAGTNADVASQLIALLGDTLARVQAAHAKEEYALSQIVASLQFVNHTVDSWANASLQEAESSELHVYESGLSAVSKSIDAVLGEARLVRRSKKLANAKGVTSTVENSTSQKSKAAEQEKKTLERFSQALHIRPTKKVGVDREECHSSFSAAHEMLLRWMESNTQRSFPVVAQPKHVKSAERLNAAQKFLDALWTIRGSPADSETKDKDASGGDLIGIAAEDDGSSSSSTLKQVAAITYRVQKNVEELQALCKLVEKRRLHSELLSPHMTISDASEQDHHLVVKEEESAEGSSWLPAWMCCKILGTQVKRIIMEHEIQDSPTLYSHLQQPLATMRLMHSIHTSIFHCHLQAMLSQCSFLKASSSGKRTCSVLSSSSAYMGIRLVHCLACNNGKALFSVARRVDMT